MDAAEETQAIPMNDVEFCLQWARRTHSGLDFIATGEFGAARFQEHFGCLPPSTPGQNLAFYDFIVTFNRQEAARRRDKNDRDAVKAMEQFADKMQEICTALRLAGVAPEPCHGKYF